MTIDPLETPSRADIRRRQVLEAASLCFRERGFHSTSMAEIAARCRMSVGHIYRYFASKEAIIDAIVRQDVDSALAAVAELENTPGDIFAVLIEHVSQGVARVSDPAKAALRMEVRAEAARNPKIAAILQAADAELRGALLRVTAPARPSGWSAADMAARVEMLMTVFEAVPLRAVSNPGLDRRALLEVTRLVIAAILDRKV